MKRLIPAISLAVVMLSVAPAEAQTLTRVNRSSVFSRAAANRSPSLQRSQQLARQRGQTVKARSARTKQTRALHRMKHRSRLGARTQSSQTIVGTKREIAAQKRRIQRQQLNKMPDRGQSQMRVIKRRLATEAEARMFRPKPAIR